MKTDNNLDKLALIDAIRESYGVPLSRLEFTPRGEDGYNYVGWNGDARTHFVKLYRPTEPDAVVYSLRVSRQLNGAGYKPAVPPISTGTGETHAQYEGFFLIVFDFLHGQSLYPDYAKPYGEDASDDEFAAMGDLIAALHAATDRIPTQNAPTESFGYRYEATLRIFLDGALNVVPTNNWQREVVALWNEHRADVAETFERFRKLAATVRQRERRLVITHGDAHLDNVMRDAQGRYHLIDWTDALLGPPERDLTFYTGERFELFLDRYLAAFDPGPLDVDVFAFYLYQWVVCEIGCYTERVVFTNVGRVLDEQNAGDVEELRDYMPPNPQGIESGIDAIRDALTRRGVARKED